MKRGWIALLVAALAADQLAKLWAREVLLAQHGGALALWPGVVGWRFADNAGAAFSALAGQKWFLIAASSVLVVAVLAYLIFRRDMPSSLRAGLALIAAGGIGNLIDRLRFGYVVDFIEFQFMRFAIFNFADICITFGVGIVIIGMLVTGGERVGRKHLSSRTE